jgi:hypothetical protein
MLFRGCSDETRLPARSGVPPKTTRRFHQRNLLAQLLVAILTSIHCLSPMTLILRRGERGLGCRNLPIMLVYDRD